MKESEWKALEQIWSDAYWKSLDAAGQAYLEAFGIGVKDGGIDEQFRKLFEEALGQRKAEVEIPIRLALAMALRSGGRPRGNRRKPAVARGAEQMLLNMAERLWAENRAQNKMKPKAERLTRGELKRNAAEAAHAKYGKRARIDIATALDRMGRKRDRIFGS